MCALRGPRADNFMGDALMWQSKFPHISKAARVLVFGPAGHGKSTLVNNLTSLFEKTYEEVAVAARSSQHVTLNNSLITANAKPEIKFLDSVGLDFVLDNYSNGVLKAVATGELPHKFRVLDGNVAQALQEARASGIPATDREMHAAIVVLSYSIRDEDDNAKTILRTHIQELNHLHLVPIIVVTNVDLVTSPEDLAALPDQFERITGIEKTRIFLLCNRPFTPEDPGFLGQRKMLYKILMTALKNTDLKLRKLNDERGGQAPSVAAVRTSPLHGLNGNSAYIAPSPSVTATSPTQTESGRESATPPPAPLDVVSEWFSVTTEDGSVMLDIYEPISKVNKLADVRSKIETDDDAVNTLGQFYFVNKTSKQLVQPANESRAPFAIAMKSNAEQPIFLVRLHDAKTSLPPPY